MRNIFFLSVQFEFVDLILQGAKRWEFRENPGFGILSHLELAVGDVIFVVSLARENASIPCLCLVNNILRGNKYFSYFHNYESGHWKEAACQDDSVRNWEYFEQDILHRYTVAIGLDAYPVVPPIDVATIIHKTKQRPWSGKGFTLAEDLHRFSIEGKNVLAYCTELSEKILGETNHEEEESRNRT
ncbi:hypothetical protein ACFL5F_06720 [Planctomycetota bacterium]